MTIIEETWRRLERRLGERGADGQTVANMREGFVAGVYAASASMISENAASRDISEAAGRVEQRR